MTHYKPVLWIKASSDVSLDKWTILLPFLITYYKSLSEKKNILQAQFLLLTKASSYGGLDKRQKDTWSRKPHLPNGVPRLFPRGIYVYGVFIGTPYTLR